MIEEEQKKADKAKKDRSKEVKKIKSEILELQNKMMK